ncbi:D-threo-aldose 1-dehydrogenase [Spathaspora passalidarum NRRL Y-27907]|uniref:D-threo-aldose 1-dehydrogenase n=1 Tax=Spathaspora passalidarum (strain NRRL Y-27907 / 11-Y1) TaxID=619300 RepID=G3ASA8_SPAPN|nr:D-threo-aldose 1-dehydrogenase [Spathaspora passalidarum NRRL Y-27907]EGW30648.1 D-threo-aldose 1-dehydrogenase [Spathaspora passalidarum NRRL Y-27907]
MTKAIGKSEVVEPYSIKNIPPLIIGGAVFNTQYSSDPHSLPIQEIIQTAFDLGINALDTSPYYGPSEELIGNALTKITYPRESYYICTKVGRVKLNDFDYSRSSVRKSIERSLTRLNTTYLDLVYMHDIEFVEENEIIEALKELKLLKVEGKVKNIGISGYPIKFLYKIALLAKSNPEIGPLDGILSYCNGCIQNIKLFEYYDRLINECGIQKVMNGSILSMSLLRSDITHSFHPASQELKDKVYDISQQLLKEDNVELAELATRFALREWLFETTKQTSSELTWNESTAIVLGVSNIKELKVAIDSYWNIKENVHNINTTDIPLVKKVQDLLGKQHFNEVWPSGIPGRD